MAYRMNLGIQDNDGVYMPIDFADDATVLRYLKAATGVDYSAADLHAWRQINADSRELDWNWREIFRLQLNAAAAFAVRDYEPGAYAAVEQFFGEVAYIEAGNLAVEYMTHPLFAATHWGSARKYGVFPEDDKLWVTDNRNFIRRVLATCNLNPAAAEFVTCAYAG